MKNIVSIHSDQNGEERKSRMGITKVVIKQDEVQRSAEAAMVLSDVSKTVQRRKWVQMSHDFRVSPEVCNVK